MKTFLEKYKREYRAALMLLLVYSTHLFAFHSLVASNRHQLIKAGTLKSSEKKNSRTTDCFLLLVKHQLNKQKDESREEIVIPLVKEALTLRKPVAKPNICLTRQQLSPESYRLYQRHRVLLI